MTDNSETSGDTKKTNTSNTERPRSLDALKEHLILHKIEVALWTTRVLTILLAIGYVLPVFGNSENAYYKVLMANAATSALRLHQRMPRVSLTMAFLSKLLWEDSCHYLLYSVIFLYANSNVFILFPVVLFAILHAASYSLTLLDTLGQNSWWGARLLISIVEFQTRNILRFAALFEILIMPVTVYLVFRSRTGFVTPFIYYQFLVLRYASRRNPNTKNVFHELRLAAEQIANNSKCPPIIRKIIIAGINFVTRLAPREQHA